MPITSVPIPPPAGSRYPKRKRREISYAETDFSDENLESSVIDADLACPLVKLINLNRRKKSVPSSSKRTFFPFMKLPPELRDQIYREALVHNSSKGVAILTERRHHRRVAYGEELPPLNVSLLAVSKTVKAEAEHWLYSCNQFQFRNSKDMHVFLSSITPYTRGLLRFITVRDDWIKPVSTSMNYTAFSLLAEGGTNLRSLRLHSDAHRGWDGEESRAAKMIYRDSFHWFDAMVRAHGIIAAVNTVDLTELDWSFSYNKETQKMTWASLGTVYTPTVAPLIIGELEKLVMSECLRTKGINGKGKARR